MKLHTTNSRELGGISTFRVNIGPTTLISLQSGHVAYVLELIHFQCTVGQEIRSLVVGTYEAQKYIALLEPFVKPV